MSKTSPTSLRILHLLRLLMEETDDEQGLSLPQIQEQLEGRGISVERKALYRDFDALEQAGFTIGRIAGRPVHYYLATRPFTPAQMTLLMDAVQTSRSIAQGNSRDLIERLKGLVSRRQAQLMDPRIHATGRIKAQDESIFNTLDIIQRAISEQRDISFTYRRYDIHKQLQEIPAADGKERIKTPLFLIYSDDRYYLLVFDAAAHDHLRSYRVDRMHQVMIREASPKRHRPDPTFDIGQYEQHTPGMFAKEPQTIKLLVAEELVGSIIDLFGADGPSNTEAQNVTEIEADKQGSRRWANMRITAAPSPVLFGQIAQFGGDVRIVYPKSVVQAYEKHLDRVIQAHKLSV